MPATPIPASTAPASLDTPLDVTTGAVADPTNGNSTPNNGRLRLLIQNTGSSSDTINVTRVETVDGATLPVRAITVAAGKNELTAYFPTQVFGSSLQYKAGAATTKFVPIQF